MATPPTFVADYSTGFSATTSPRTVSVTVANGDVLAVMGAGEDGGLPLTTPSGGGLTYTLQASISGVANFATAYGWTALPSSGQTYTFSQGFTGGGTHLFGSDPLRFSGSDGVGAATATNTTGAPSLDITTTQDNSAVCVVVSDWNAGDGSTRTWRTVNSITPTAGNGYERVYFQDATRATVYVAYYPDVGAAGTKTVGLTAPTGQKYSIVAVEVKGAASSPAPSGLVAGPYAGPAPGRISPTGVWSTQVLDFALAVATSASAESTAGNGNAFDAAIVITVNADVAAGSGVAGAPQVGAGALVDQTAGTGAANDAVAAAGANAESTSATGAALAATVAATASADQTAGTGTANDAAAAITVNAENAAATGAANDATVSTASFVNADAGLAAGTGAANDASVAATAAAEAASATGAAFDATIAITIPAGVATGTGQAFDGQGGAGGQADVAAGSGAASVESLAIQANAEAAAALGAALDPTAATGGPGNANAGLASAAGTAYDARVRKLILRPNTGVTARPNTGTTARPNTGITQRP